MLIGIDNGLEGALAVLSTVPGLPIVELIPMPVMRSVLTHRVISSAGAKGASRKARIKRPDAREVDAVALKAIFVRLGVHKISAVIFEGCPDHASSALSMKSMAQSDGRINTILELLGLAPLTMRILSHTWHQPMLGSVPVGKTKLYAERVARALWPEQDWRRTPKCKTADTGFVDAALIARWGLTLTETKTKTNG